MNSRVRREERYVYGSHVGSVSKKSAWVIAPMKPRCRKSGRGWRIWRVDRLGGACVWERAMLRWRKEDASTWRVDSAWKWRMPGPGRGWCL